MSSGFVNIIVTYLRNHYYHKILLLLTELDFYSNSSFIILNVCLAWITMLLVL
jgi:hypothetical protein